MHCVIRLDHLLFRLFIRWLAISKPVINRLPMKSPMSSYLPAGDSPLLGDLVHRRSGNLKIRCDLLDGHHRGLMFLHAAPRKDYCTTEDFLRAQSREKLQSILDYYKLMDTGGLTMDLMVLSLKQQQSANQNEPTAAIMNLTGAIRPSIYCPPDAVRPRAGYLLQRPRCLTAHPHTLRSRSRASAASA